YTPCTTRITSISLHDALPILIVGRPQDGVHYEDYKKVWRQILKQAGREDLPVLYNMNFGHNEPKFIVPYGLQAEVDTENLTFRILENAVRSEEHTSELQSRFDIV